MGNRPRITRSAPMGIVVFDPLEYIPNMANSFTRKLVDVQIDLTFNAHYAKHYANRDQFGEDDGTPRDGIDIPTITNVVERVIDHMIYYSFRKQFSFINTTEPTTGYPKRFGVSVEQPGGEILNVVLEGHSIDKKTCELTVITAMIKRNFFHRTGEYYIVLLDESHSELWFIDRAGARCVDSL